MGLVVLLIISLLVSSPGVNAQDCEETIDLMLVLDGSKSIDYPDFGIMKRFSHDVVDAFDLAPDTIRIGIVQFSTRVRLEIGLSDDADAVHEAIDDMTQMRDLTEIGDGLGRAHREFRNAGRPGVSQVVILLTDGRDDGNPARDAQSLKDDGIHILSIGVGDEVNKQQLREISSNNRVFSVADFDSLLDIINELVDTVCYIETPQPSPVPPPAATPQPEPTPEPVADFPTRCSIEGGWYGEYSSTRSAEGLNEAPRPILEGVTQPQDGRMRHNPYYGFWGSGYFWSGQLDAGNNAILQQNPVYYTCDDDLNYNWQTGLRATDMFDDHYAFIGEPEDLTIYDMNNADLMTGERRAYLGTDYWSAHWRKTHTFDPDGDGSNGCLTTKVSDASGSVREQCIPGLHLIRMSVNDGGRWFLNGGVPDIPHGWGANRIASFSLNSGSLDLFWYDAFQDRKEMINIGYVLFTEQYANDLGFSRTTPFDAQIDVEYYEKDGRASLSFFIDPFTDQTRSTLLSPYAAARVADATLQQDDVWDDVVIPEEMLTLPPLDTVDGPEGPQLGPLSPGEVVAWVYLPVVSR
jgi:uncharacterized protein YegL